MKKYFRDCVAYSDNTYLIEALNKWYYDYKLVSVAYNPDYKTYVAYLEKEVEE